MRFLLATIVSAFASRNQFLIPNNENEVAVEKLTHKLEHIVDGMSNVKTQQKASQFSKMISPYVAKMAAVLKDVKESTSMTTEQKKEKLEKAQEEVSAIMATEMQKFGQKLVDDDVSQNTTLLLGLLLERKNKPMKKQMEALTDKQFSSLPVVMWMREHRKKGSLVEQVAAYLDAHPTKMGAFKELSTEKIPAKSNQTIAPEDMSKELNKITERAKEVKWAIGVLNAELTICESSITVLKEGNIHSMKGTLVVLKNFTNSQAQARNNRPIEKILPQVEEAIKLWEKSDKKEKAEQVLKVQIEAIQGERNVLQDAKRELISAEMKHLKTAKAQLQKSNPTEGFDQLQKESDELGSLLSELRKKELIHDPNEGQADPTALLIQLQTVTEVNCPYRKATCIEKCHDSEHTFTECLPTCADK